MYTFYIPTVAASGHGYSSTLTQQGMPYTI